MVKFRYKVEREVQFPMKYIRGNYKCKQMFGGGIVSTDTLNSEAIMINIGDYNSKSMGIL